MLQTFFICKPCKILCVSYYLGAKLEYPSATYLRNKKKLSKI